MSNLHIRDVFSSLRPSWWPFLFVHCLAGFAVIEGTAAFELSWLGWLQAVTACLLWAVVLGGASTALASVLSEPDAQEAARKEPVAWVGIGMILAGLPLALCISWGYWDAYRAGMLLLAVYATPPISLCRRPVAAAVIEGAGLGGLTFFAGFAVMGHVRPTLDPFVSVYLFAFIFLYIAMRVAYSQEESRMTPWLYWFAVGAGFASLAAAGVMMGNKWSAGLLLIPLAVWCVAGLDRFDRQHRERYGRTAALAGAWLLTDVAVAFAAMLR